ncbi:MAG: hypothetical protein J5666_01265, partial [Bacilli bacterium]|nr:hypothetical protein [Bacilli bacterium]
VVTGRCIEIEEMALTFDPSIHTLELIMSILSISLFFAIGAFSSVKFFKENEPSGELAGKPQGRDPFQMSIFHATFIMFAFLTSMTSIFSTFFGIITVLTGTVMFGAVYYVLLGLIRRNFRLDKVTLIFLISTTGLKLLLSVVALIITSIQSL